MEKTVIPNFFIKKKNKKKYHNNNLNLNNFSLKATKENQSKFFKNPKILNLKKIERLSTLGDNKKFISSKISYRLSSSTKKTTNFIIKTTNKNRSSILNSSLRSSQKFKKTKNSQKINCLNPLITKYLSNDKKKNRNISNPIRQTNISSRRVIQPPRLSIGGYENLSDFLKAIKKHPSKQSTPLINLSKSLDNISGLNVIRLNNISDKYLVLKKLGEGSSATVSLIKDILTNEKFVIKIINSKCLTSERKVKIALVICISK